jgi:hypothetical protein
MSSSAIRANLASIGPGFPLPTLLTQLPEFRLAGPSSLWRLLDRLEIRWLRGRAHVHSPDPLYQQKRDYIKQIDQRVRKTPEEEVLLYQDECSYYVLSEVTFAYAPALQATIGRMASSAQ